MNSYDHLKHEFIWIMNSYMNSGAPRFQMYFRCIRPPPRRAAAPASSRPQTQIKWIQARLAPGRRQRMVRRAEPSRPRATGEVKRGSTGWGDFDRQAG